MSNTASTALSPSSTTGAGTSGAAGLLDRLHWRYATKAMDPGRKVAQDKVDRIDAMFDLTNEVRGIRNEGWEKYRTQLLATYPQRGAEVNYAHAARQACIALGASLIAAAYEEVDSTPMEGFDPDALDAILGLRAQGLRSVAILPLGYRLAEKDWLVNLEKVRRPLAQFVSQV